MPSFIRNPKDFFAGLLFLIISLGELYIAQDYSMGTARRMGPGYFPVVLGMILTAFALIMIFRALLGKRDVMDSFAFKPLILILGGSLLFAVMVRPIGMFPAIVVMVFLSALGSKASRPLPALLLGLGLAVGSVLAFVKGLGQPIPVLGSWFGDLNYILHLGP